MKVMSLVAALPPSHASGLGTLREERVVVQITEGSRPCSTLGLSSVLLLLLQPSKLKISSALPGDMDGIPEARVVNGNRAIGAMKGI